jgi:predicted glycosyltransferase
VSGQVLIVDDQQIFARNVIAHLRSAGFTPHMASHAEQARELLGGGKFDAMCLDLNLPDGHGLDLLARVRRSRPDLPVLVMSGEDSKSNRRRATELGAAEFLIKPFALRDLLGSVRRLTGWQASARGARPSGGRDASKPTVMMYSHDGFGLGHMRRNLNIASRFVEEMPGASVLMLVGSPSAELMSLPLGVDFVKLPSIIKVGTNDWRPRRLQLSNDSAMELRSRLIKRAAESLRPSLFVADHVPTGVWGELLPTLRMFRQMRRPPRVVLGLRDIIDDPSTVRRAWQRDGIYDAISEFYDELFIYGRREVFDSAAHYGLDGLDRCAVRYCGYVCSEQTPDAPERVRARLGVNARPLVVVTGGGGHDAYPMMKASLEALVHIAPEVRPRMVLITGPLMDAEGRRRLVRRAEGLPVEVLTAVPNCLDHLAAADAVVSMAGYNTVLEALRLAKPLVVIPRAGPSAEQRTRAGILSRLGLATTIDPDEVDPQRLADAIVDELGRDRRPASAFAGNGAIEAAMRMKAMVTENDHRGRHLIDFPLEEAVSC